MHRSVRLLTSTFVVVLALAGVAACSSDDDGGDSSSPETTASSAPADSSTTTAPDDAACTTASTGPMQIVLGNDDGVGDEAIDVLIDTLKSSDMAVNVSVVTPAEERSGSSDATTPDGVTNTQTTTPGGNVAYAVDGTPADAVAVALDDLGLEPHLVVAGINLGQNFGTFAELSGTIGLARQAIRREVPALAVSSGFEFDPGQFQAAADLALGWVDTNCEALMAREFQTDTLASIVVPNCAPEDMGEMLEVSRATEMPEDGNVFESTCDQADPAPANDVAAAMAGYPSVTQIEAEL